MSVKGLHIVQGDLEAGHTHVQTKTAPETKESALLDDFLRRFDGPFALVVVADGVVTPGGVLFRHQSGVLCRVLHQLEGTCSCVSSRNVGNWFIFNQQAMNVDRQPDKAPAAPKHNSVAGVGVLPGLLTVTSGSSIPVTFPMADENLYFAF